jgi:hypothetical protein
MKKEHARAGNTVYAALRIAHSAWDGPRHFQRTAVISEGDATGRSNAQIKKQRAFGVCETSRP